MIFHLDSCFFVHHFAFLKVFGFVKHVDRAAGLAQGAMDRGGLEVGRRSFHITWTCRFSKRLAVCGIQWWVCDLELEMWRIGVSLGTFRHPYFPWFFGYYQRKILSALGWCAIFFPCVL